jgi:hypothetical protein
MTTPAERLLRAVYTAAAVYDDAVSLHATDADWPGLRGHSGPLKVYSTTRRTHVATRSGATIFLEDPPGQPAPSPVLKFPDRRRRAV